LHDIIDQTVPNQTVPNTQNTSNALKIRLKSKMKMYLKKTGEVCIDLVHLAQDRKCAGLLYPRE
jgi:hypothetical protein